MFGRHALLTFARALALLGVAALFAVLVYRIARGNPAARLIRAVDAQRAPAAPNVRLTVIWPRSSTWPRRLRASIGRGTLSLGALRGYPVVLNFWASWCSPCRREAAVLSSAAQAQRGRVVFIGVDVHDLTSDARRFLGSQQIPYVAVHADGSIADRFGLIGLPETFYLDRLGRIRGITRGELSAAGLERQVKRASRD